MCKCGVHQIRLPRVEFMTRVPLLLSSLSTSMRFDDCCQYKFLHAGKGADRFCFGPTTLSAGGLPMGRNGRE